MIRDVLHKSVHLLNPPPPVDIPHSSARVIRKRKSQELAESMVQQLESAVPFQ
jgi:hypothetical protein